MSIQSYSVFDEVMNVSKNDKWSNKTARGDYIISAFAAMIDFAPKTGLWSEFKNLIQINLDLEQPSVSQCSTT
jgi:hypothetical protein